MRPAPKTQRMLRTRFNQDEDLSSTRRRTILLAGQRARLDRCGRDGSVPQIPRRELRSAGRRGAPEDDRRSGQYEPLLAMPVSMDIITWLVVGLVAGVLASVAMRGWASGLFGNIVLGIAGALLGGWGFRELGWNAPLPGIAGVIVVAFLGAVAVLAIVRLLGGRARRA